MADPLVIASLQGGLNDADDPVAIPNTACSVAENVEFFLSMLGERRLGCLAANLPATITGNAALTAVTWGFRHLPTSDFGDAELWLLAQSLTTADNLLVRRTKSSWSTVTPSDAPDTTGWRGHKFDAQTLNGKMFLTFKSAANRPHVWDGTTLRRVGLAAPAAPVTANTVGGGAYASTRYARVRFVALDGSGKVLRRSEPSPTTTFAPSGANDGMVVSRPALVNEGETHWEIELSTDGAEGNFYRMSRQLIAVTSYTDTTAFATGYTSGALSEDIGKYTLWESVKYFCADGDRLIGGGHQTDDSLASTVYWSVVNGDPGAGNDERIDATITSHQDLDPSDGGGLTGIHRGPLGYVYAFKLSRIYKFTRTNSRQKSYEIVNLTDQMGALPNSIVQTFDNEGRPCLNFLDYRLGPCRISYYGIERCGYDVRTTWSGVNKDAAIPCHGQYYGDKQQVHYWIASGGVQYPNSKIVCQTNAQRRGESGVRGGWSTVPVGDRIADAHCSVLFSVNLDSTDNRSFQLVPFIGKQRWIVGASTISDLLQRCDVGQKDADSAGDTESAYYTRVRTKAFVIGSLLEMSEVVRGAVLANAADGATLTVRLMRNFSETDTRDVPTDLTPRPKEQEASVVRLLDDLGLSEVYALQIEYGDLDETVIPSVGWAVNRMDFATS